MIESEALAGNFVGIPPMQEVKVYLPPGYDSDPGRRYPTLYLLHGIGGDASVWTEASTGIGVPAMMDRLISARRVDEMIIVMPTARGPLGGTFYIDSSANGGWGTFLSEELVGLVDSELRTIRSPKARAVAGHSMGGFGAVRAAMDHPGTYGVVWAMSPCCLAWVGDMGADNPAWTAIPGAESPEALLEAAMERRELWPVSMAAIARAFSPVANREPWYFELPYEPDGAGGVRLRDEVAARWRRQFPLDRLPEHSEPLRELSLLAFDYGYDDFFTHIPAGVEAFSDALDTATIPHQVHAYAGDHGNRVARRMETVILPAISSALAANARQPEGSAQL